jgi:hypothetical protein
MSMIWNRDDSVSLTVTWSRASMTTMTKRMMMMNEVRWSMRHKISAIGGGDSAECTHEIPVWYRNTHARQLCSAVVPVVFCQFREGHVRGNLWSGTIGRDHRARHVGVTGIAARCRHLGLWDVESGPEAGVSRYVSRYVSRLFHDMFVYLSGLRREPRH